MLLDLEQRPVRINSLWWPTQAKRFAVANLLVSEARLQQISSVVYAGGGYQTATLEIKQTQRLPGGDLAFPADVQVGSTTLHSTQMWGLCQRCLARCSSSSTPRGQPLWLLTLADDRYWWWYRDSGTIAVDGKTTTWYDLYESIADALKVTITQDDVPDAYLKPPAAFPSYYEPSPLLLDWVAFSVGQRVVRQLDGTVLARNPVNSALDQGNDLLLQANVQGGGNFRFDPSVSPNDLPTILPAVVRVVFPSTTGAAPFVVDTTLASLLLPDLSGAVTNDNLATFSNMNASDGTNDASLTTLAQQFATDWYRFQVSTLDIKFNGIIPWVPEAMDNYVEWHHGPDGEWTRVMRGPMNPKMSAGPGRAMNLW